MHRPRQASHAHFCHSHIPELICGVNSSIDIEQEVGLCGSCNHLYMLSATNSSSN